MLLLIPVSPDVVYFRFKVDRKIYVVGFGLYGSIHGQSEYETSIEVGWVLSISRSFLHAI